MKVCDVPGAIRKPWGWTVDILTEPTLQISLLDIEAGGECSRHWHWWKANRFYVRSGELLVRVFSWGGYRESRLRPGEHLDIQANVIHQFMAPVPCRVWEIYTPGEEGAIVDPGDIVRLGEQSAVA